MAKNIDSTDSSDFPIAIAVDNQYEQMPPTPHVPYTTQRMHWIQRGAMNICRTIALAFLNAISFAFALVSFILVVTTISVGVPLIPLACIGFLLLTIFWQLLGPIAKVDEYLFMQRKAIYTSIRESINGGD